MYVSINLSYGKEGEFFFVSYLIKKLKFLTGII